MEFLLLGLENSRELELRPPPLACHRKTKRRHLNYGRHFQSPHARAHTNLDELGARHRQIAILGVPIGHSGRVRLGHQGQIVLILAAYHTFHAGKQQIHTHAQYRTESTHTKGLPPSTTRKHGRLQKAEIEGVAVHAQLYTHVVIEFSATTRIPRSGSSTMPQCALPMFQCSTDHRGSGSSEDQGERCQQGNARGGQDAVGVSSGTLIHASHSASLEWQMSPHICCASKNPPHVRLTQSPHWASESSKPLTTTRCWSHSPPLNPAQIIRRSVNRQHTNRMAIDAEPASQVHPQLGFAAFSICEDNSGKQGMKACALTRPAARSDAQERPGLSNDPSVHDPSAFITRQASVARQNLVNTNHSQQAHSVSGCMPEAVVRNCRRKVN